MNQSVAQLHALLFAQPSGVKLSELCHFMQADETTVRKQIAQLETWLQDSGVTLFSHKNVYALVVDSSVSEKVEAFIPEQKQQLSQPMLEVLAIVAHTQPCSKQDIDDIRGVSSDQTLRNLTSLGLIRTTTKPDDQLGLTYYETTKDFLLQAGLKNIAELTS